MHSRIAALVVCALVAGCLYDWSTGKTQNDAGGGGTDCPSGSCVVVCQASTTCSNACSGGSCTMSCAAGSTCDFSCAGGSCIITCDKGATCTASCAGGSCICTGVACPP